MDNNIYFWLIRAHKKINGYFSAWTPRTAASQRRSRAIQLQRRNPQQGYTQEEVLGELLRL